MRIFSTLRAVALGAVLAGTLAACATRDGMTTGSIPDEAASSSRQSVVSMNTTELDIAARRVGTAYENNPDDKSVGLSYAAILRMTGRNDQALAVMRQMAIKHPSDGEVLAAFGKAQAAAGDLPAALQTIRRAQTPDRPDWKLLSAEGAVLDQLGKQAEARERYEKALQFAPEEPAVLSNLAMSHLLSGDLKEAEAYLRRAIASPQADSRVRQNLALVIGLQGRFDEAERIAAGELPAEKASANIAYLRAMLSQRQSWAALSDDKATD